MSDKASIIKEAQGYLAKGQIDKAIAEWEKLITEYPDGNTYNVIGDLYLKKGDKKNAIGSFHEAASFFWRDGFFLKALALYKKILNIDPANSDALFSLGELNEKKGLTADAIKYYLAAADIFSKEGKKEKLLDIFNKILAISPDNIPLRNKVAELYAKEGLGAEAVKEYLYIARVYEEKGEIEKSMGYYQKVIDIQPLNREAILRINHIYEKAGKLEQAIKQMKEAIILLPQDTDIHLRCAELYIMGERFDEARECLRKVAEIEPANIEARRLLGDIYIKEGDREKAWIEYLPILDKMILDEKYDNAVKLIESFKDIDPVETGKRLISLYRQLGEEVKAANELISLGNLLTTMGMQKEAVNYYKEALSITPDDDSLRAKVAGLEEGEKGVDEVLLEADIFLRYALYDEARELLEKLKVRETENIDIHTKLKSIYIETGDKEMAVTECLILAELYNRAGNIEQREQVLKEAYEINPEDPRL
ncbi:MAG: tetratricopeptide repeat protein, partial [Nitrospirota bacterium]